MEHQLTVVGIGPGHPDYILPTGLNEIRLAKILAGSRRALDTFASADQEIRIVDGNVQDFMDWAAAAIHRNDIVVMVSGDPGYYSLLDAISRRFSDCRIRVIPGISSFQIAFARLGLSWHDATLISFHGREPEMGRLVFSPGRLMSCLTDGKNNPAVIASKLMNLGWQTASEVWLCRNLSYAEETIYHGRLEEIVGIEGFDNCVMVVRG